MITEKETEKTTVRDVETARKLLYGEMDYNAYPRREEPAAQEAAATFARPRPVMQSYLSPKEDIVPSDRTMNVAFKPTNYTAAPPTYNPAPQTVERPKQERRQNYAQEDLMPSIITMNVIKDREEKRTAATAKPEKKSALDTRTKVMVALYIALVAILAITIIITGLAVSKANNRVNALESTKGEIVSTINEQIGKLSIISDEAIIESRAVSELDMVNGGEVTKITLVPVREKLVVETNWFSEICDWISSIFGN